MRLGQILLISQKDQVSSRACSSFVKPRADEKKDDTRTKDRPKLNHQLFWTLELA